MSFRCPTCKKVLATAKGANVTICGGNVTIAGDFPPPNMMAPWVKCTDHNVFLVADGASATNTSTGGSGASGGIVVRFRGEEMLVGDWMMQASGGGTYYHHFLYVGAGKFVSRQQKGVVLEPTSKYIGTKATRVLRGGQGAADRARARVGESGYNLLTNNCEHFCSQICGRGHHSEQVRVGTGKLLTQTLHRKAYHHTSWLA